MRELNASPAATAYGPCGTCALRLFCLASCEEAQPAPGEPCVRRLEAGAMLHRKGEPVTALRAVRSGAIKTCAVLAGGERRVVGYHIAGDVLGLDALGSRSHPTEAVAIDACELCELPLERAEALMAARPSLSTRMRTLLSEQIARDGERMVALAAYSASQRVAGFVLEVARRRAGSGHEGDRFDLCLTRKEIGSYLGLTFETVSRALSQLAARGCISVAGREVRILDRRALEERALAG